MSEQEELPTYKLVADVIVSPTDSIVIGLGDEQAYLNSVSPENRVATVGDVDTQGVPAGGTGGQILAKVDGDDYNTEWVTSSAAGDGVDTSFVVAGGTLGTQPTFDGDPLFTGSYVRTGPMVHFRIDVDFSNITSFGSGQYYLDLPFPSKYNYQFASGCYHDISTGRDYPIFGHVEAGESRMVLKSIDASGNTAYNVPFTATTPVTLNAEDNFHVSGDYIGDFEVA
jgi:hypothetical protein